jgi:hypothetical protein
VDRLVRRNQYVHGPTPDITMVRQVVITPSMNARHATYVSWFPRQVQHWNGGVVPSGWPNMTTEDVLISREFYVDGPDVPAPDQFPLLPSVLTGRVGDFDN